jgi:hypothetical protein
LGAIAFLTTAVRGLVHQQGTEQTLLAATACLAVFAGIGFLAGELAAWIVTDSVRARIATQAVDGREAAAAAERTPTA